MDQKFSSALLATSEELDFDDNDLSSLSGRIRYILDNVFDGDLAQLSSNADVSTSAVRTYLSGASEPSLEKAKQIARSAGVTLLWLAAGEGPIWNNSELYRVSSMYHVAQKLSRSGGVQPTDESLPVLEYVSLPAGSLKRLGAKFESTHAFSYTGYSMAPTIPSSSVLLLNSESRSVNSGLYLFGRPSYDGNNELIYDVRRMHRQVDGKVIIMADNDRYPSDTLDLESFQAVTVLGRIVSIISKYDV